MRRTAPDGTHRSRTISLAVTPDEYDAIHETGVLVGRSVSSWGRDLLVADMLRTRNRLT